MYRKIGVAVDDSATSLQAFQAALKLAQTSGGSIVVIHVVSAVHLLRMGIGVGDETLLQAEVERRGREQVWAALRGMGVQGVVPDIKIVPSYGDDIVTLLLKAVKEENCQVLVMGTKGRTGLHSLLVGSVAEGVLRKSPVPVLMVRAQEH